MPPRRVGFHLRFPFHHAMLDPVARALAPDVECLATEDLEALAGFAPPVVVVADGLHYAELRALLPGSLIVWTRHGFASKNARTLGAIGCDFACVSSTWVRDDLLESGVRPRQRYWVTGFPAMDRVLSPPRRPAGDRAPTVLYAPTWNRRLGSADALGAGWLTALQAAAPGTRIVVKPHPALLREAPDLVAAWRAAGDSVHVETADDDVYRWFAETDVLVSDASSVVFYFLAMDRPVVLYTNPEAAGDQHYFDPAGPEWTWRDLADEASAPDALVDAITAALRDPGLRATQRARYRERVFGTLTDGRAGERIAGHVRTLLADEAEQPAWVRAAWASAAAEPREAARRRELETTIESLSARVRGLEEVHADAARHSALAHGRIAELEQDALALRTRVHELEAELAIAATAASPPARAGWVPRRR
jgi:hypothetical protein